MNIFSRFCQSSFIYDVFVMKIFKCSMQLNLSIFHLLWILNHSLKDFLYTKAKVEFPHAYENNTQTKQMMGFVKKAFASCNVQTPASSCCLPSLPTHPPHLSLSCSGLLGFS
jgi:hypothetical protein